MGSKLVACADSIEGHVCDAREIKHAADERARVCAGL